MRAEGIPQGYHPRHPLNTALSREPMVCDGCGRSSTVLMGFEKPGAPDMQFCLDCVERYEVEKSTDG